MRLQTLVQNITLYIEQKKNRCISMPPWGCTAEQLRLLTGLRVMTWLTGIGDSPHTSCWKWVSRVGEWLMAVLSAATTVFSAESGQSWGKRRAGCLTSLQPPHRQYGVKRKCICLNAYFAACNHNINCFMTACVCDWVCLSETPIRDVSGKRFCVVKMTLFD